jgi:hypothetical protein
MPSYDPPCCAPVDHAVTPKVASARLYKRKHLRTNEVQPEKSCLFTA